MSEKKQRNLTNYLKHRPYMKSGDLLLFSPDTLLSKIIRFKTGYDITHIGFLFRHEFIDNHVVSLEALENGTGICRLSKRIRNYGKGKIYWLPLKEEYDCYRNDLAKSAILSASAEFPTRSLVGSIVAPTVVDYEKMLCSEYCIYPYEKWIIGFSKPHKLYPGAFEDLSIFKDRVLITMED